VSKTLGQLDRRFQGFASLSFLPSRVRCSKASNGGFFRLLSCPRSVFLADLSSSISSSNDLLSLTSLHLFFSFAHFDPVSVTVSSAQFAFYLFFLNLHLLPYPRANRPPTLTCDSSRGTSDLIFLFYFDFRLRRAAFAFSSIPPSLPSLCRLSFLCLVPSFNCTWYLDPFPHAFTESCEATGCHNTTSTAPIH
jgi:hypothetical protein